MSWPAARRSGDVAGRRSSSRTPASTRTRPGPIPETQYSVRYESFRSLRRCLGDRGQPCQHRQSGRGDGRRGRGRMVPSTMDRDWGRGRCLLPRTGAANGIDSGDGQGAVMVPGAGAGKAASHWVRVRGEGCADHPPRSYEMFSHSCFHHGTRRKGGRGFDSWAKESHWHLPVCKHNQYPGKVRMLLPGRQPLHYLQVFGSLGTRLQAKPSQQPGTSDTPDSACLRQFVASANPQAHDQGRRGGRAAVTG